jgi:MoxR-like ATPase
MSTATSAQFADAVRESIAKVVVGQDSVVERLLIALFTGGHLLLRGMPGLAKTLLVNCLARTVDLQFSRVPFTIDLLPSDIAGTRLRSARLARNSQRVIVAQGEGSLRRSTTRVAA